MKYLKSTKDIPLTLEAENSGCIRWWVDTSFAVHPDMKSHSGAMMYMGQGAEISGSNKQKLNTKSSTESELVGVDDCMPIIIWVKYFLEAQCYTVSNNLLQQDNQSLIKLEKNGKASGGKITRHIAIRYYFVTNRISGGYLRVDYCPTEKMLADFFTKPLQGKLFRVFRSMLMNIQQTYFPQYFEYPIVYASITTGYNGTVSGSMQECVGRHTKLTDKQTGMETKNGCLQTL